MSPLVGDRIEPIKSHYGHSDKLLEGQRVSLENGKEYVGGGTGEREIIWKKRASVIERERAREREREREEEERKNGAQYTVWRLREGFQERRDREGEQGKSAEGAREPQPEVIWKRREEEEKESERIQLEDRGPRIIWRKKEREGEVRRNMYASDLKQKGEREGKRSAE
ncbi:hypothetical protein PDJAM_G00009740 [Pangasius djambal]|uniref:Uncharacterized protein n=1 Tax=Pangasius djambal TaxID=1691987 RepID=A0ACC5XZJ2_9TELE|nr:hypothetical protein [Pangasius djambal]